MAWLVVGEPIPCDLWNEQGLLLLAKGQTIRTPDQLRRLAVHRPLIRGEDHPVWERLAKRPQGVAPAPSPPAMDSERLSVPPPRDGSVLPAAELWHVLRRQDAFEPLQAWDRVRRALVLLLEHPESCREWPAGVEALGKVIGHLLQHQPDASLFWLLHNLQDLTQAHSTSHALWVAALSWAAQNDSPLSPQLDGPLVQAALTMNIAMTELHNRLALQPFPPDDLQRRRIRAHPTDGVLKLTGLGVRDENWLRLVGEHHERPDGSGYPYGRRDLSVTQRTLSALDRFGAMVSPRATRPALAPLVGLRQLHAFDDSFLQTLSEWLSRFLGFYPPASYVRLASGENAIVVRRGPTPKQPLVKVLTNPEGIALPVPILRYTGRTGFEVVSALPPAAVRIRFDPARMLQGV